MKALAARSASVIARFKRRLDEKYDNALAELRETEANTKHSTTELSELKRASAKKGMETAKKIKKDGEKLISDAMNAFDRIYEYRSSTKSKDIKLLKPLEEQFDKHLWWMDWRMKEWDMIAGRR